MKFVIVDHIHPCFVDLLTQAGHECVSVADQPEHVAIEQMKLAQGVVLRGRFSFTKHFIDSLPKLKLIGRVGAGLEHIDVEYAKSKGITVLSSPEGNRQAVAEHALAMLLSLFNHIPKVDAEVRQGIWLRKQNEGLELQGKIFGIIGYGNTGAALAQLLRGFNTPVLAYDKFKRGFGNSWVEEVSMEMIFKDADVVSLHLPLTNETNALVNSSWLEKFHKPIYLINTSRGGIVNTADLLRNLNAGRVLGACLDVLEFETENLLMPSYDDLPDVAKALFNHPNVLLSPHTAGLTTESYVKLSRVLAEKIIQVTAGA
jgi:D-3-phosphoglycerate dehydrogenase